MEAVRSCWGARRELLVLLEELVILAFLFNSAVLIIKAAPTLLSLRMAVLHFGEALVPTLSIASRFWRGRWWTAQSPGEASCSGFPDRNLAFLIVGVAQALTAAEDGCGTPILTLRHFLVPLQIPQPAHGDPSSH